MPSTEPKNKVWEELRKPFPKEAVGKIPKGGVQLDYIGHAAVTDRLNSAVGPENWSLDPLSFSEDGSPLIREGSSNAVMWCRLTVMGASKLCVGTVKKNAFELEKELIGDALRNGAMRFGVALELWSKDELESNIGHEPAKPTVYNRDDFQPEPVRDIAESEGITEEALTKLKGALKLKGITTLKQQDLILSVLAKEKQAETIADVSLDQSRQIYAKIRDTDAPDLIALTEPF